MPLFHHWLDWLELSGLAIVVAFMLTVIVLQAGDRGPSK